MQKNIDYFLTKGPMAVLENINKIQNKVVKILDDTLNIDLKSCVSHTDFTPAADFYENDTTFHIELDLPGMHIKDIDITLNHDRLVVLGLRKSPHKPVSEEELEEEPSDRYIEKDIDYGSFERIFCLPAEVDESKIKASYHNGVLNITVPKVKESKLKKIKIETESK